MVESVVKETKTSLSHTTMSSTEQHNNGGSTPPQAPSGDKGKGKETEEQAAQRVEDERAEEARRNEQERLEEDRERREEDEAQKQRSVDALLRILTIEEKKTSAKLERIQWQRQRAGFLSQELAAHALDNAGEAELADLLRGSSPLADEVPDEPNDESTSEEDEYQAPPEDDGGKKRRRAEKKKVGKTGREIRSGRPEKRRRTETKKRTETEDAELTHLDEEEAWISRQPSK